MFQVGVTHQLPLPTGPTPQPQAVQVASILPLKSAAGWTNKPESLTWWATTTRGSYSLQWNSEWSVRTTLTPFTWSTPLHRHLMKVQWKKGEDSLSLLIIRIITEGWFVCFNGTFSILFTQPRKTINSFFKGKVKPQGVSWPYSGVKYHLQGRRVSRQSYEASEPWK